MVNRKLLNWVKIECSQTSSTFSFSVSVQQQRSLQILLFLVTKSISIILIFPPSENPLYSCLAFSLNIFSGRFQVFPFMQNDGWLDGNCASFFAFACQLERLSLANKAFKNRLLRINLSPKRYFREFTSINCVISL